MASIKIQKEISPRKPKKHMTHPGPARLAHLGQPSQRDRQAVLDGPQATSHPMVTGEAHHTVAWPQRLHRKSAEFPRNWWLLTRNDRLRWFNESSCVDSEMLVLATTVFFHQNAGEYVFCIQKKGWQRKSGISNSRRSWKAALLGHGTLLALRMAEKYLQIWKVSDTKTPCLGPHHFCWKNQHAG